MESLVLQSIRFEYFFFFCQITWEKMHEFYFKIRTHYYLMFHEKHNCFTWRPCHFNVILKHQDRSIAIFTSFRWVSFLITQVYFLQRKIIQNKFEFISKRFTLPDRNIEVAFFTSACLYVWRRGNLLWPWCLPYSYPVALYEPINYMNYLYKPLNMVH